MSIRDLEIFFPFLINIIFVSKFLTPLSYLMKRNGMFEDCLSRRYLFTFALKTPWLCLLRKTDAVNVVPFFCFWCLNRLLRKGGISTIKGWNAAELLVVRYGNGDAFSNNIVSWLINCWLSMFQGRSNHPLFVPPIPRALSWRDDMLI